MKFQTFGQIIPPHIWMDVTYKGFIYKIDNPVDNKFYIGRKGFRSSGGDWRYYAGSSKLLNADIKRLGGKHRLLYEVLDYCKTERDLVLKEAYWQIHFNVLEDESSYNQNIFCKYFKFKTDY